MLYKMPLWSLNISEGVAFYKNSVGWSLKESLWEMSSCSRGISCMVLQFVETWHFIKRTKNGGFAFYKISCFVGAFNKKSTRFLHFINPMVLWNASLVIPPGIQRGMVCPEGCLSLAFICANYSDLLAPVCHPKWWSSKGIPPKFLIQDHLGMIREFAQIHFYSSGELPRTTGRKMFLGAVLCPGP